MTERGVRHSVRVLWTAAGTVFLAIGVAGVILPMLPGTIFLFIASACFVRGSERLHRWLVNHRLLGPHVRMVASGAPMPRRAKVFAIGAMWIAVAISIYISSLVAVQIALAALAAIGTVVIARR